MPVADLGPNYCKRSGLARHKWMYRMLKLRNSKPSAYRSNLQSAIEMDAVLQADWAAYWDQVAGYLTSRGMELGNFLGVSADPRLQYNAQVAGGLIPYNVWSGQPYEGMTSLQRKDLALRSRCIRSRFEVLFQQWHNVTDAAGVSLPGLGDGGEGGQVNDPAVTD